MTGPAAANGSTGRGGRVTLRPLLADDVDAVAAIEGRVSPQPWPRSLFAGELALPATSRHWLVAEVEPGSTGADPEVVGFGGMMFASDTAHLMNLGVVPERARAGIGLRLCLGLIAEARARGSLELTLEVRVSNEPAIALYRKLGLEEEGRRPSYYPDGEDAAIFWLRHLDGPEVTVRLDALAAEVAAHADSDPGPGWSEVVS